MFFNFARFFTQPQQLDNLIANPDCDLETILSTDGILQEIKGLGATKFADHVIQHPEMYQKMIDYIIQFEEELIDKKTQIQQILDYIVQSKKKFCFQDFEKLCKYTIIQQKQAIIVLIISCKKQCQLQK